MIDLSKKYTTRSGHKVKGLRYKPLNECGNKVTFPIKGSILRPKREPEYGIWKEDGSYSLFGEHKLDLIEAKE